MSTHSRSEAARLRAARTIWRARHARSVTEHAYRAYALVLVAITAVAPLGAAVWMSVTHPAVVTFFTAPFDTVTVPLAITLGLVAALTLGRRHGPALASPVLVHVFAGSDLARATVFRRPVFLLATAMALCGALIAGIGAAGVSAAGVSAAGVSAADAGLTGAGAAFGSGLVEALPVAAIGACTGFIAALLALVSEAFPRTGLLLAGALAAAGLSTAATGAFAGISQLQLLLGFGTLAGALTITAPTVMNRIPIMTLRTQAQRFDEVLVFSGALDFSLAAGAYRDPPRVGRRLRAVREKGRLPVTLFMRDAIGVVRRPGTLCGAFLGTVLSGALVALSLTPHTPGVLFAGAAAAILYIASGSFAPGLLHAAKAAGDLPLYGVSDRRLLAMHTVFPATVLVFLLTVSAAATTWAFDMPWFFEASWIAGMPIGPTVVAAPFLGILVLVARLRSALAGPIPPRLLTPVESPAGDVSIVVQLGWALGELVLAVGAGLALTQLPITPMPVTGVAVMIGAVLMLRWRSRR